MSHIKSDRILLSIYLLILIAHITLIWVLKYIPTQDGPSHIYNLAVLRDLLQGGEIWGTYYTHDLQLIPNLGFHIFAYPLTAFLSPWQTEKAFLTLYICLMGLSVPVMLKAFQRPVFPVCFLVFPVIFNFTILMGFYSYSIAIPFFLLFFSLAWMIRSKPAHWKIPIYSLCGFFLFCLHLIPFIFYMLALFCIIVSENFNKHIKRKSLLQNIASIAPLLVIFSFYKWNNRGPIFYNFDYLLSIERLGYLFAEFISFSSMNYTIVYFIPLSLFTAIFWMLMLISVKNDFLGRHYKLIFNSPYFLTATVLLLVYILFPFYLADGAYFNQRFPWVIFLLALPIIRIPKDNFLFQIKLVIILSSVTLVFLFNTIFMWRHSMLVEQYMSGLGVPLHKNSLIINYKRYGLDTSRIDVLLHAVSHYALFHKTVNAGNYEARTDYFPVQLKETFPPVPPLKSIQLLAREIEWDLYPNIEYLVAWEIGQYEGKDISSFFGMVFQEQNLSIWRRKQN